MSKKLNSSTQLWGLGYSWYILFPNFTSDWSLMCKNLTTQHYREGSSMTMILLRTGGWLSAPALCYSFPRKCLLWSLLTQHSFWDESLPWYLRAQVCVRFAGDGSLGSDHCQTSSPAAASNNSPSSSSPTSLPPSSSSPSQPCFPRAGEQNKNNL